VAYPEIAFSLIHNDRQTLHAPPVTGIQDRIYQLFGDEATDHLLPLRLADDDVRVEGYISDHTVSRSSKNRHFIFINRRSVQDPLVDRAVRDAYGGILDSGRFPAVFLHIHIDPADVDFNVHPTKKRVRFRRASWLFRFLRDGIRQCYALSAPVPSILTSPAEDETSGAPHMARSPGLRRASPENMPQQPGLSAVRSGESAGGEAPYPVHEGPEAGPPAVLEAVRTLGGGAKPVGQYRNCYILAESAEGLLLIDQHVAHERILYEKLRREFKNRAVERQMFLHPATVPVSPDLFHLVEDRLEDFRKLGFEMEIFGGDTVLVMSHPALLPAGKAAAAVSDILERLGEETAGQTRKSAEDRMMISIACHAAIKVNQVLTPDKMRYLVDRLFETEEPYFCPHGRPIIFMLDHHFIQRKFKRE
jgi:DNA mismatch repair protein MutL